MAAMWATATSAMVAERSTLHSLVNDSAVKEEIGSYEKLVETIVQGAQT